VLISVNGIDVVEMEYDAVLTLIRRALPVRPATAAADGTGADEVLRLANGTLAKPLRLAFISPKEYGRKKKKKKKQTMQNRESMRRLSVVGST
jgi:hypothetical protein